MLLILTIAWFCSLLLTQYRVQQESLNIQAEQDSGGSQFKWDFENKNDIIESDIKIWESSDNGLTLIPGGLNKKYLSLNFSGATINSLHYNKIILDSNSQMQGHMSIEFKTDFDDEFYFYSPKIKLTGTHQIIDLQMTWRGQNSDQSKIIKATWGTSKQKISSLVLYFENLPQDFNIKSIGLPLVKKEYEIVEYDVNCNGNIKANKMVNPINKSRFVLDDFCFFPSTYMWLSQELQQTYPGSFLQLKNLLPLVSLKPQSGNLSYTRLTLINSFLYATLALIFALIYRMTRSFQVKVIQEEPWYKWLGRKISMQELRPYNFMFSYAVILGPTFFLILILTYFQLPSMSVFKDLPMYFLWAIVQQFILGYILAQRIFYNHIQNKFIASLFAGLVFGLIHMPSTTLMLATFIGGFGWSLAWLWFKRFIPLAISHAVLALMFYNTIPDQYLYSAKVLQWFWK